MCSAHTTQRADVASDLFCEGIGTEIENLVLGYIQAQSFTSSAAEKSAEAFFVDYFAKLPYFKENPTLFGASPIAGDPFERAVCYAMVRGTGPDTLVLLHHYDVVPIDDYKTLKHCAFTPAVLQEELRKMQDSLAPEAWHDLESDEWLFGHGVCDMKGGGAIQMALLKRYSEVTDFRGNVIVLGVPDEENLSAGMRAAVLLLDAWREQYGLRYRLAINSEPHQRKTPHKGVFSIGSVGKLMPFLYVRGALAHAGKVFEGFNPLHLMSEVVRRTELNMDLSDIVANEAAPPPTWLYLRDDKSQYDVSMPLSVFGCFSILTLDQTPPTAMERLRRVCEEAFADVLARMERNYIRFQKARGQDNYTLPWQVKVLDFAQLYREAADAHGSRFVEAYDAFVEDLRQRMASDDAISLIDCHSKLVTFVYDYITDLSPRVVYGLIPPYYPNVSNHMLPDTPQDIAALPDTLRAYAQATFGQEYETERYYTGISDLSYTSLTDVESIDATLRDAMPLYQRLYDLPLDSIRRIAMPCINIGPWGKDFHKLTERVLRADLTHRTPALLHKAIMTLLPQDGGSD